MAANHDLDIHSELRLIPQLADVSKEALAELAAGAQQRRAHAGTVLVEQGSPSLSLIFLFRGAAKVSRSIVGGGGEVQVVLDVMRAPCIIADVSVLDGQPATGTVTILRSSHMALVDRRIVHRIAGSHGSFARAILARAALDLRAHTRRIDQIVGGPVDERIKQLLDSLAEQHGTPLGHGRFIAIPLRRRDLACMVNATTETVSRLLAKFEREGFARSTRDGIWWKPTPRETPGSNVRVAASPSSSAPPSSPDAPANVPPSSTSLRSVPRV